jgi:hypothetical protein
LAPWREEATKPRPLISRSAGADLNSKLYDLPFERNGWNTTNGAVMPLISFFVWDPRFLELDLKLKEGVPAISPETVRVKIGLESLERESVRKTADGWLARFRGPKQPRYQNGLQIAFVAFVPKERLADAKTPWRLERVQWDAPGRGKAER